MKLFTDNDFNPLSPGEGRGEVTQGSKGFRHLAGQQ